MNLYTCDSEERECGVCTGVNTCCLLLGDKVRAKNKVRYHSRFLGVNDDFITGE
jgi:hypothetical protein